MMLLSLLLTIVSLSSCTISTNNKDKIYNKEFKIEIKNTYNSKDKKTFKNQKENEMELEEFARYGITIYVPDEIYKSFDYNYNNTCNNILVLIITMTILIFSLNIVQVSTGQFIMIYMLKICSSLNR